MIQKLANSFGAFLYLNNARCKFVIASARAHDNSARCLLIIIVTHRDSVRECEKTMCACFAESSSYKQTRGVNVT